ncbi:MAG: adenylate cyclase [Elusimicrobia bacterium]|nr:MAG: adenylate cyclase [Elusimicrobiota bacterium]KAF0158142.1 MAG: adenylate cyclase [Elusimicrobiota bacterium]
MKVSTENKKAIYTFGAVFSALIAFTLMFQVFVTLTGGWLRGINNLWMDFRVTLPYHLSTLFLEEKSYEYGLGKMFNRPADPRISIAAIDNHTLNELGYPFPRKYYGRLFEKLNALGAKVIVMDVMIFDPDKARPGSDAAFVRSAEKAGNVINLMHLDRWNNSFQLPIKGLDQASRYVAIPNMDLTVDKGNKVKHIYLFDPQFGYENAYEKGLNTSCPETECGVSPLPGLAASAYAAYTGLSLPEVWRKFGGEADPDFPRLINYRYPKTRYSHPGWSRKEQEEFKTRPTTYSLYRYISFLDILEGRLSREEKEAVKGGIIMVGSTAIGAYDHYPSPFMPNLPGVEVHANALDNMLNDDFLTPVRAPVLLLLCLLAIWTPIWLRKYSVTATTLVAVGLLFFLLVLDHYMLHKLYEFAFSTVAISLFFPFVFITVHKALMENREKKWIKSTFGQYLSPKVVDVITRDPSKLSLGGEKRDMTAFFLDIAGFTTMSEKLPPEQLTQLLNEYLSALTDVVLKNDGVVDKYIGDCIMAFWNAPLDQKDHRRLAVLAAVDCQSEMARLNRELTQFEIKPSCRIGLNSGSMVVGNMGSRTRLSYTVMGDSVNLASRLEGANKFFHSRIMASEYTFSDLRDQFDHRYLGSIRVVGKVIPVKVYEPFARKGEAPADVKELLKNYEAGMEKFYKGDYKASIKDFKAALAARPGDGPSQYYIETAEVYAKEPPRDWDQSFNLTSKG